MSMFVLQEAGRPLIVVGGLSPGEAAVMEQEAQSAGHPTERLVPIPRDIGTAAILNFMREQGPGTVLSTPHSGRATTAAG